MKKYLGSAILLSIVILTVMGLAIAFDNTTVVHNPPFFDREIHNVEIIDVTFKPSGFRTHDSTVVETNESFFVLDNTETVPKGNITLCIAPSTHYDGEYRLLWVERR